MKQNGVILQVMVYFIIFNIEDCEDNSRVGITEDSFLEALGLNTTLIGDNEYAKTSRTINYKYSREAASLLLAEKKLTKYCEGLKLCTRVLDICKSVYLRCKDFSRSPCIPAIILIGCRLGRTVRNLSEISSVTGLPKNNIQSQYLSIINCLHISLPRITTRDYVERYGSCLSLDRYIIETSLRIIDEVQNKKYVAVSNSNNSLSAACILFTSYLTGKTLSASDVAEVADLNQGTIKSMYILLYFRYNSLYSHREDLAFFLWNNKQLSDIKSKTDLYKIIDSLPSRTELRH